MRNLKKFKSWTPSLPFYYGWAVLFLSFVATYLSNGSAQITMSGIQTYILEDTGWDRSTLSLTVTLGTFTAGFVTPVFGRLVDISGPRMIMPFAALTVGICFVWISGTSGFTQFFAGYIVARGIGTPALIAIVPRTIVVNFFYKKRNLALGLQSMARPLAGAFNIQMFSYISERSGWRTGYRTLGIYGFIIALPLLLFMRKTPEEIGLLPDGETTTVIKNGGMRHKENIKVNEMSWSARDAIRTYSFWFLAVSQFIGMLVLGTMSFQFVPYLHESGLSIAMAAIAWSLASIMDAISNPIWGLFGDKYSPRPLILIAIPSAAFITSGFLLIDGGYIGFALVVAWGTFVGGLEILGGMLLANYYGRDSYGTISGILTPFQITGLGLGPFLGSTIYIMSGSYTPLFIFAVCGYLISFSLVLIARKPIRRIKI